jgi:hypothetical protein
MKGCSAGPISKDGKQPTNRSMKQCRIYASEEDNKNKRDSCYLEKERIKVQCPVVNRNSPPAEPVFGNNKFLYFYCRYPFELEMPEGCLDRKSGTNYFNQTNPNWRTNNARSVEDSFCENYIRRREQAREAKRRREEAEARAKRLQESLSRFRGLFSRSQKTTSRLQQQLDEANRKLQNCKR